jgi:hypothetical protein
VGVVTVLGGVGIWIGFYSSWIGPGLGKVSHLFLGLGTLWFMRYVVMVSISLVMGEIGRNGVELGIFGRDMYPVVLGLVLEHTIDI